jgi:hypothetical protein
MSKSWYDVVGPAARLTQGDIIQECPFLKWKIDSSAEDEAKTADERLFRAATGFKADVIVMSQACDLEHGKISDVVLCPCRSLSSYKDAWMKAMQSKGQTPTPKSWAKFCDEIKDGYVWNLFMMDQHNSDQLKCEHWIVDFHHIYTVPRMFIDSMLIERGAVRLRLCPPYREHLSQAFARYFMRVGLPTPLSRAW